MIGTLVVIAALGGNCHVQQLQQVQAVAVPQVIYQNVYYQVAPQVYTAELVAELQQLRAALKVQTQPAADTAPEVVKPRTMIAQKCAKCHTGDVPKAGLYLDGTTEVGCSSITEALRQIAAGTMPPPESGVTLSPAEKGQLMQELLDLERKP